jgi:DNA-binding response OmpR family regulator
MHPPLINTFLKVDEFLSINPANYQIKTGAEWHRLPKKEFELLNLLAGHPQIAFSREALLQNIWGSDIIVSPRTVDVHIHKIRERIGSSYIETIKAVGYRFASNPVAKQA